MTAPAADDRLHIDDARWYPAPDGGEPLISVTTALDVLDKSEGLVRWAAKLAADAAMEDPGRIVTATITPPCERNPCRGHDWRTTCAQCPCGTCEACVARWLANRHYREKHRRADEGTDVHRVLATWAQQGMWMGTTPLIAGYVESIRHWIRDYAVTPHDVVLSEQRVCNLEHRYAGTLDLVVDIFAGRTDRTDRLCEHHGKDVVRVLLDLKTREREGSDIYPVVGLQNSGYRNATHIITDTGTAPMVGVDVCFVLHVEPGRYVFRPVGNSEGAFPAFLLAMQLARYMWEEGSSLVAHQPYVMRPSPRLEVEDGSVAPKPPTPKKTAKATPPPQPAAAVPPPRKRAPAKKTAPAAAAAPPRAAVSPTRAALAAASASPAPAPAQGSLYNDEIPF